MHSSTSGPNLVTSLPAFLAFLGGGGGETGHKATVGQPYILKGKIQLQVAHGILKLAIQTRC